MSSPGARVRSRRSAGALRVGVTKAGSGLAAVLAEQVAGSGDHVVGLDQQAGAAGVVEWRLCDIAAPEVVEALRDVDAVVHVAHDADLVRSLASPSAVRRARLVREMQTLSTAAAAAGVGHLVVVSSVLVYGARADNPAPVPDDSPLRADDVEGVVADLVEVEAIVETARTVHPGLEITVVRPAALVGPSVDTIITRHFEAPRLLVVRDHEPTWQFCHVEDLGRALLTVLHADVPPVVTVGSWGSLTQAEVEEISGMRRIELSWSAAYGAADRLHRIGVLPLPASDLAYVSHPLVVEPRALAERGWAPAYDNTAALGVLLEGVRGHHAVMARRVQRKDAAALGAAAGAASAAVAAAATAALMRRRKRRT
ncbi:NAD-dependent epimerase/dehydratase family protein [Ornithinicoccus hortensis]|uniref:Nucleoside-diphosphate-sugar epimerase n=1 Tax=Ornithinicoccus hortensis TaxID=82346 RepID=A0A542YQ44_9MICO|nr:NAD-dependent epimerase/dehydratase family protein [Ornithinicoccus hortensis]TQL50177.1 nucleoside-diphosphate-sugar epimerase [Ornithinicoccus hortensis]